MGHPDWTGHSTTRLTGVVVDALVGLGYHSSLAARAAGGEHEHSDGTGDECAEQAPEPRSPPDPRAQVYAAAVHENPGQTLRTLVANA
jgi:hypothetical protein